MSFKEAYLDVAYRNKGIGGWRLLYLMLMQHDFFKNMNSIIELGAGAPDFLVKSPFKKKTAVDINGLYARKYKENNIDFLLMDLDRINSVNNICRFDIVVCSDVFEHIVSPHNLLENIKNIMEPAGVLFSHVPNEYSLKKTIFVMLGLTNSLYFHKNQEEWNDPHLHRFTLIGYKRFLELCFKYNIYIGHLRYARIARILHVCFRKVPYCLQGGPTFISTNNSQTYSNVLSLVKNFRHPVNKYEPLQ